MPGTATVVVSAAALMALSCQSAFIGPIGLKKCPSAQSKAFSVAGGKALDVSFQYWSVSPCSANVTGTTTAGASVPGGPHTGNMVSDISVLKGITTADFACDGEGTGGSCTFRIAHVDTPGGTPNVGETTRKRGLDCQTTTAPPETIFDDTMSDVVVRVTVPDGCTAALKDDTGATASVSAAGGTDVESYIAFARAQKITATCTGSGHGRCSFEWRAWR